MGESVWAQKAAEEAYAAVGDETPRLVRDEREKPRLVRGEREKPRLVRDERETRGLATAGDEGLSAERATGPEEEQEQGEDEGEEGREPVRARTPRPVSKEEREAHEVTHTPYRAWCRHCQGQRAEHAALQQEP